MKNLKKIFTLKSNDKIEAKSVEEKPKEDLTITFFQSGYGSSKRATGNPTVFGACLDEVYMDFKKKCELDEELQHKLKTPHLDEKAKLEIELKKRQTAKGLTEEYINDRGEKINHLKNEIADVKENPEKYVDDVDKKPKAQFYIGLLILIPVTFYLLVFYISTSYSAFFKDFEQISDLGLKNTILSADALTKAFKDGVLEGIFVLTIPFAFMGLGYLIHMFQKHKDKLSYLKIASLFIVTFIFDAILAYLVEKKIYDIEKTLNSPEFDLPIAFTKVEFWGIIFAGFVVYIIWGLVFDFIMKEYESIDKIKAFIKSKRENIKNIEELILKEQEKLNVIKTEVVEFEGKIDDKQRIIDGIIFPQKQYLSYHTEYVRGWYLAISDDIASKQKREELLDKCEVVKEEHLKKHDVLPTSNSERIIYRKIS